MSENEIDDGDWDVDTAPPPKPKRPRGRPTKAKATAKVKAPKVERPAREPRIGDQVRYFEPVNDNGALKEFSGRLVEEGKESLGGGWHVNIDVAAGAGGMPLKTRRNVRYSAEPKARHWTFRD